MSTINSGVYPVYEHQFKINAAGRGTGNFVDIADMETFSVSFDDNVEEWTPMTTSGWVRRLKTGKGLTISLNGKRNIGDAGNDYIASLAFKSGQACNSTLQWNFPDGTSVLIPCVINITAAGGDSTNVDPLEFECMSDGAPTVSGAYLEPLTVVSVAGSASGKTKIYVNPVVESGHTYKYQTGAAVPLPAYNEVCTTGYTALTVGSDIAATAGNQIVVVEVDGSNKAIKAGIATIVAAV